MPFSHHSHSGQFCLHAQNTLEEMVQTAISRKLRVFALTEHMPRDRHCDLYPEEVRNYQIEANQSPADLYKIFAAYYKEAMRLKHAYASEITILVGFESDYIRPSSTGVIEDLLGQYHWDMFVGSVHHVRTIPIDFDRPLYEKARRAAGGTDELLFQAYFDEQFDMLRALKPPVVGHFDLIRLKSDDPECSFQQWDGVWERILRNLTFIQSYGGLMELNSAGLRKGLSEPYPNAEISKAFLEKNGRFTLSDDSHSVDHVMLNYDRVFQFVREIGIATLHFLERGKASSDSRFPSVSISGMPTSEWEQSTPSPILRASMRPSFEPEASGQEEPVRANCIEKRQLLDIPQVLQITAPAT
ncbi:MAG: histidinolphosphatase [Geoglossum umbratile]|nr:MAG: histidinolphosphatase [Geoglossum umbratile]